MPEYCYTCPKDHLTVDFVYSYVNRKKKVKCKECGKDATRDYTAEHGRKRNASCGKLRSTAAGVAVEQIPEMVKANPDHKFDPKTGDMIFKDRNHKLKCLKEIGMHDRDEIRG